MSGHSKWANRKHRKERQDAKKGKIFSKIAKEIMVAARQGGADPDANARLRIAIEKAKEYSVPAENVERAIKRGAGGSDGAQYEELMYEGYGPGGVAILLEIMTDNRNRTAGEIRYIFSRNGGNLGESGSVAWQFERKGLLVIDREGSALDEDTVLMLALEAGAEDVKTEDDSFQIVTAVDDVWSVKGKLEQQGIRFSESGLAMLPKTDVRVEGKEAQQLLKLIDALEDHDDVQNVYANFSMDEKELAEFEI